MAEEDILAASATATQGMIPQQQGSMTSFSPSPMQMPISQPRFQAPPLQFGRTGNEFQTVGGRKRADKEALFHGIASLIKSGGDYIEAKKQRSLTMDITRLMEAQQGRQEAEAQLKQNPQDQEARAAYEKNSSLINDITSDPKKVKNLQKAFNLDLFGNGKNKKENAALAQAWKEFGEKQKTDKGALNPIAQKMTQQQPQRMQMDPQAAMQAQAIKMGLIPKAGEILRANMEVFRTLQTAKTAEERNASVQKAAETLAEARKYGADKVVDAANVRALGAQAAAMIRFKADIIKSNKMLEAVSIRVDAMRDIAGMKAGDKKNGTGIANLYKEAQVIKGRVTELVKKKEDISKELDKYAESSGWYGKIKSAIGQGSKSNLTPEQAKDLQKNLFMINMEQKSVEGQWADIQQRMDTMTKIGGMPDPSMHDDPENIFAGEND